MRRSKERAGDDRLVIALLERAAEEERRDRAAAARLRDAPGEERVAEALAAAMRSARARRWFRASVIAAAVLALLGLAIGGVRGGRHDASGPPANGETLLGDRRAPCDAVVPIEPIGPVSGITAFRWQAAGVPPGARTTLRVRPLRVGASVVEVDAAGGVWVPPATALSAWGAEFEWQVRIDDGVRTRASPWVAVRSP